MEKFYILRVRSRRQLRRHLRKVRMPIMSSCLWLRSVDGSELKLRKKETSMGADDLEVLRMSHDGVVGLRNSMDFFRAFCEGECHSSSSLVSIEDCVDFVPDFFAQHPCFLEHEELSLPPFTVGSNSRQATVGVAGVNDYWFNSLDTSSTDFHWNKPESSLCSNGNNSVLISGSLLEEEYLNGCKQVPTENNLSVITRDGIVGAGTFFPKWSEVILDATASVDEDVGYKRFENHDESDAGLPLKRKFQDVEVGKRVDHDSSTSSCDNNPKKRTKISRDGQHDSNTVKSKKGRKHEGKAVSDGPSCSTTSSEEEIAFRENNGKPTSESMASAVTVCGKIRASRGSATDPQSVYAKKRREKINERLRILQTLVPNGTKVDISTMLEEAVEYVKFLQLQIQLLSSDELWMYAPLAYNGFDIGLHQKMSLFQPQ